MHHAWNGDFITSSVMNLQYGKTINKYVFRDGYKFQSSVFLILNSLEGLEARGAQLAQPSPKISCAFLNGTTLGG